MRQARVAIVDGFSTGDQLAQALNELGAACVHVFSGTDTPALFMRGFRPERYVSVLPATSDTPTLLHALRKLKVDAVLAGTESGVLRAEELAQALGLSDNEPSLSGARRLKGDMMEQLESAGVRVPASRVVGSVEAALEAYSELGLERCVVKPVDSAGADNVHFCAHPEEVQRAAQRIFSGSNVFGHQNVKALVQEQIAGVEYHINSVSRDSVHYAVEVWRYYRARGEFANVVLDYEEPVDEATDLFAQLARFTCTALSALGIVHAASHTEVIRQADGSLCLIEVGARLGGKTLRTVLQTHAQTSQTDEWARLVLDPSYRPVTTKWQRHVRNVGLINLSAGRAHGQWQKHVRALDSCVALAAASQPGDDLVPTRDYPTSPGFAYLVDDDPTAVDRDYQLLRRWESTHPYTG